MQDRLTLLQCENLKKSDKHFEALIGSGLLGEIEPGEGELDHLSHLITLELEKPFSELKGSLSAAIFLVWMGYVHYQDGNFWGPVYNKLGLSLEQVKWQSVLGENFIMTIKKYDLPVFQGKLRYISPILIHGIIPDWYLENYFDHVILTIYINREKFELKVERDEIEHLVSSWRKNFGSYEKYVHKIAKMERAEEKLVNIIEAWKNKDALLKLQKLQDMLIDRHELNELLILPEDWLNKIEAEQSNYNERLDLTNDWLKDYRDLLEVRKIKSADLQALELEMLETANKICERWDDSFAEIIIASHMVEISEVAERVATSRNLLVGFKGWILKIFMPSRYKEISGLRQRLIDLLGSLPIKLKILTDPWPILPRTLLQLQEIIEQYKDTKSALDEIDASCKKASPVNKAKFADRQDLQKKLDALTQQAAGYKTKLVRLGKGDLEKGKAILAEQTELHQEINQLRSQIPGNLNTLLENLSLAQKHADVNQLERRLTKVRKKKKETRDHLKTYKNPLYGLNESTRFFIFQGGAKAVDFIFNSLLLIDSLHKDDRCIEGLLPKRIEKAMRLWWEGKGSGLIEQALVEKVREREIEEGRAYIRKPLIKFDAVNKEFKAVLPRQPASRQANAVFAVKGILGQKQEVQTPITFDENDYWSESAELVLARPSPLFEFSFHCGEINRSWNIGGIGWDRFCMLFNKQGEMVENDKLPDDGVYIIAPADSTVELIESSRERLTGHWSDYGYWYVELHNTDVILVRFGKDVTIFKRIAQIEPMLLSKGIMQGITSEGNIVYKEKHPDLLFSINRTDELPFYGIRLDFPNGTEFRSLEVLDISVKPDNVIYVTLAGLTKGKYGLHKISLIKRDVVIWSGLYVMIPEIEIIFDQQVYRIQDKNKEIGKLQFCSKHEFDFILDNNSKNFYWRLSPDIIEFDTRQNSIRGKLVFLLERKVAVKICIDVPAIRWRIVGYDWKARIEEIWHEDLGEVDIRVPCAVGGSIRLGLEGESQVIEHPVRQGIATFDLRRFSDTLRSSNKAVQKLFLSSSNKDIPPNVLVQVRMRWQAERISLTQRLQDGIRYLFIEWEDCGKASNRLVRLWPLDMPDTELFYQDIPDGVSSFEITAPKELLPSGRYRLHIILVDPWGADIVAKPDFDTENCIDVDVGIKEEILETYIGKKLDIIELCNKDQSVRPATRYWLEEIDLNPTFKEEFRLTGNVYSLAEDGTIIEMPYNPVSFYLTENKMPFLIDKDGDGVTYCQKCRVLFWEVAHKECGDAVFQPEPILVKVRG